MIPLAYRQPGITAADTGELPLGYQAAVERFARYLKVANRSPNTARLYLAGVRRWLLAGGSPGHVDGSALAAWLGVRRRSTTPATVNIDIKALRAFYRLQSEWGDCDPGELMKIPRQRRQPARLPRYLTVEDIDVVLATLPVDTYLGLRDYALIRLAFEAGLRASELAQMALGDLLQDATLFVRGKGGRDRYVPIAPPLMGVLNAYLAARSRTRPGKRHAWWLREDGRQLRNGRSVWEIVSRRMRAASPGAGGIRQLAGAGRGWQGQYPHLLRASFATALLHRGCPITAIAQMLGHADVSTTAHYLGVDLNHLKATAERHPRAKRHAAALPLRR